MYLSVDIKTFAKLWRDYFKKYKSYFFLASICLIISSLSAVAQLKLLEPIFDLVMINHDIKYIFIVPILYFCFAIVRSLTTYGQNALCIVVGNKVVALMQNELYKYLLQLKSPYFIDSSSGSYLARFSYDLQMLKDAFTKSLVGFLKDLLLIISFISFLFYSNYLLTFYLIGLFPVIIIAVIFIGNKVNILAHRNQQEIAKLNTFIDESLKGLIAIFTSNAEKNMMKKGAIVFDRSRKINNKSLLISALVTPINEILAGLAIATLLSVGSWFVINGTMSIGQFTAYLAAMLLTYQPLRSLGNHFTNLQNGLAASQRFYSFIEDKSKFLSLKLSRSNESFDLQKINKTKLHRNNTLLHPNNTLPLIEFKNLNLVKDNKKILKSINFKIYQGQHIAIFGPSGAGKSSLISCLLGFEEQALNHIYLQGQKLAKLDIRNVRKLFSYQGQNFSIFNTSILENIALGDDVPSLNKAKKAAIKAQANKFILAYKNKYFEKVGETGAKLSGGQKQRIELARAFYNDAAIVILDEPSSALDKKNENNVLNNIFKNLNERTVIYITHNKEALNFATNVFQMNNGRLFTNKPIQVD